MLTKEMLEAMPMETIFATGIVDEPRLYKKPVRWIAVRGRIPDWAIYYHRAEYTIELVSREGDKCTTKEVIKKLVPCSKDAFNVYRY